MNAIINHKNLINTLPYSFIVAELILNDNGQAVDLKFVFANDVFCSLINKNQSEINDKNASELNYEFSREKLYIFQKTMLSKETQIFNEFCPFTNIFSTITIYCYEDKYLNIVIENKSMNHQATQAHLEEQKNKDTEMLFNKFMDTIPLVAWIRDYSGIHLYMNRSWEKYLKLNRDDCIGKTVYEFVDKELADKLILIDHEVISKNKIIEIENTSGLVGGIQHCWNSINFPFVSATGQKCIGSIAIEMTKQKKIEDELNACKLELERLKNSSIF